MKKKIVALCSLMAVASSSCQLPPSRTPGAEPPQPMDAAQTTAIPDAELPAAPPVDPNAPKWSFAQARIYLLTQGAGADAESILAELDPQIIAADQLVYRLNEELKVANARCDQTCQKAQREIDGKSMVIREFKKQVAEEEESDQANETRVEKLKKGISGLEREKAALLATHPVLSEMESKKAEVIAAREALSELAEQLAEIASPPQDSPDRLSVSMNDRGEASVKIEGWSIGGPRAVIDVASASAHPLTQALSFDAFVYADSTRQTLLDIYSFRLPLPAPGESAEPVLIRGELIHIARGGTPHSGVIFLNAVNR